MAYNPNDVFPGAQPSRTIDLYTICEYLDASDDVPVVYAFGAGAPTSISVNGREVLGASYTGNISPKQGVNGASGRLFVEYAPPYYS